jgi:hypothetical protein
VLLVPSLFRQTLLDSGKRCAPTRREIAGRVAYLQVRQLSSEVRDVLRRDGLTAREDWELARHTPDPIARRPLISKVDPACSQSGGAGAVNRRILACMTAPSDEYATVADLAAFTHSQLEVHRRPSPGVEVLAKLFRAMYGASMATEEGQRIAFDLTWVDPDNSDPDPPQNVYSDRWATVPFSSKIPLTSRVLIKASKATDLRTSSFAAYASSEGDIYIWGMIDQGNLAYDFRRFESEHGPDRPGLFLTSALGVGHLAVHIDYEPIAELRIDRLLTTSLNPLYSGPVLEALQPGIENYVQAIRNAASPQAYADPSSWDDSLAFQWLRTLIRVLLRIRGMGHGGAILITPDITRTGLDVKYEVTYPRLPEALQRWGAAIVGQAHARRLIRSALGRDEPTIDTKLYLDENRNKIRIEITNNEIDGALWFIASLSRIDGLILMAPDLSVHGFGTMITVEDPPGAIF